MGERLEMYVSTYMSSSCRPASVGSWSVCMSSSRSLGWHESIRRERFINAPDVANYLAVWTQQWLTVFLQASRPFRSRDLTRHWVAFEGAVVRRRRCCQLGDG